jgi:hypothetical protein
MNRRAAPSALHAGRNGGTQYPSLWTVPARYNIAADVCDRQPSHQLAMIWQDGQGHTRRVEWAEIQRDAARFAALPDRAGSPRATE